MAVVWVDEREPWMAGCSVSIQAAWKAGKVVDEMVEWMALMSVSSWVEGMDSFLAVESACVLAFAMVGWLALTEAEEMEIR